MSLTRDILLPLAALALLSVLVPVGLYRLLPRRLPQMMTNIAVSAVLLYLIGALLLAFLAIRNAPGLGDELGANPAGALWWLVREGMLPVIVWLPVLALTELVLAQRIAGGPPA